MKHGEGKDKPPPADVRAQMRAVLSSTELTQQEKQRRMRLLMSSDHAIDFDSPSSSPAPTDHAADTPGAQEAPAGPPDTMPQEEIDAAIGDGVWQDKEHTIRGCKHYRRGCYIRAACCGRVYPCRLCHDQAEDHEIDRFAPKQIVSAHCHRLQGLSNHCTNPACAADPDFGTVHYCLPCRIWSSDPAKPMFHCDKCRLCRVGTPETTRHCDTCGCCYNAAAFEGHTCHANRLSGMCPVCQRQLFGSTVPAMFLDCGHAIHSTCYTRMLRTGNVCCPLCKKYMVSMRDYDLQIKLDIATTPMPPPYNAWVSEIDCNECGKKSVVPFSICGHICPHCDTANTAVLAKRERTPDDPPPPAWPSPEEIYNQLAEFRRARRQELQSQHQQATNGNEQEQQQQEHEGEGSEEDEEDDELLGDDYSEEEDDDEEEEDGDGDEEELE